MATTLLDEILGVKQLLDSPMAQSPSFLDIVDELSAEYQHMTNVVNNTSEAWMISEYTLTTVAGQQDYRLDGDIPTFYKALAAYTIPANTSSTPQYGIEFMELEHIPKQWAWLSQTNGQYMFSSHDSQIMAFYRQLNAADGERIYVRLAPVPTEAQSYRIIYQQTDWWDAQIFQGAALDYVMPNSSQRMYLRSLAAENLLLKGAVMWSFDPVKNFSKAKIVERGIEIRKNRYKEAWDEYISSLDQPDVTIIESWADKNVFQ